MAKQTYTTGQVLTAAQMTTLQANDYNQTISAKTGNYTLVAADAGTTITMTSASATAITVNTGVFTAGDTLEIINLGAGVCTITAGTATVNTSAVLTLKQYDAGTLWFSATGTALFISADAADSPLTTKGDLYTYSTTNDRLAVGTNGQLLSADSTAATGLAWSYGGKSTAFTPTWGVESGTAPTIGNGTLGGFYSRIGDLVFFQISVLFGSTTTAGSGNYTFGIPFAMSNSAKGFTGSSQILDTGVAWYRGYQPVSVQGGFTDKFTLISAAGVTVSNTTPITFGTGDTIYAWGVYNV